MLQKAISTYEFLIGNYRITWKVKGFFFHKLADTATTDREDSSILILDESFFDIQKKIFF